MLMAVVAINRTEPNRPSQQRGSKHLLQAYMAFDDQIELSAGKSIIASPSDWPYALAFYITALTVQLCAIRRTTPIDRLEFDDVAKKNLIKIDPCASWNDNARLLLIVVQLFMECDVPAFCRETLFSFCQCGVKSKEFDFRRGMKTDCFRGRNNLSQYRPIHWQPTEPEVLRRPKCLVFKSHPKKITVHQAGITRAT
ncbi:hypothetical protein RP20_CCG017122 [Aedes albopictus]|nr:hypothetical protein RP20_CCG017122 [Aedes albopictus]